MTTTLKLILLYSLFAAFLVLFSQYIKRKVIFLRYCIYLRKSRADKESESFSGDELSCLERHEKTLLALAQNMNITVEKIYREVVSGETISSRPVVKQLLSEVEGGLWDGVLVMEVERLARGDTIDQGVVSRAFKYSSTKIITPLKIYDPLNEYDEEYFEFGLFMSRREYKTINRRLQRGRLSSASEGKFAAPRAPYGYKKVKLAGEKGYSLEIVPEESDVVKTIFTLYTEGLPLQDGSHEAFGASKIAAYLSSCGKLSKNGGNWSAASVREILKNPVYIGKIRWNRRKCVKKIVDGRVFVSRPRSDSTLILVNGLHEPIIPQELFFSAEQKLKQHGAPVKKDAQIKNSLAGIVVCGICGHNMARRPYGLDFRRDMLICPYGCKNTASRLYLVEERLIYALSLWLENYHFSFSLSQNQDNSASLASSLKSTILSLSQQLSSICDLLERGIYSEEMFLSRKQKIETAIDFTRSRLETLEAVKTSECADFSGSFTDLYHALSLPHHKNALLKLLIEKVEYLKPKSSPRPAPDGFELTIYPKLPRK